MKTLKLAFVALLALGLSTATVNAQDAKKDKGTTKSSAKKSDASTKTSTGGQHLKKDGTPDMRYKENKQAATTTAAPASSDKKSTKSTGAKSKSAAKGSEKK